MLRNERVSEIIVPTTPAPCKSVWGTMETCVSSCQNQGRLPNLHKNALQRKQQKQIRAPHNTKRIARERSLK